ncbi:MAG: hypothetical protein IPP83_09490 [Flavobacteriales bacterium]|nr:hypothetical protein [Flavobacteriales bacterium]
MHIRTYLISLLLLPLPLLACTAFVMHKDGRTFIGNNEDSWCTHGLVRFAPAANGHYGAVYFSSWTGHPYKDWGDQIGMNEAGLVFDGLGIQPKDAIAQPGKQRLQFAELTTRLMERCASVPEAVAFLEDYNRSFLHQSMMFLADANGAYAIVQSDTVIVGNEPHFAVGNWRMTCNTDMDAVPIPRLQQGRTLLAAGVPATVEGALSVLRSMRSCREFLGNGTFFSTLFEPDRGLIHLYFYHDFEQPVIFDLREELAKGAHTLDLPSLFPPNAEFQALQAYRTPFHQRWLFWGLMTWAGLAMLLGLVCGLVVIVRVGRRVLGKAWKPVWPLFLVGSGMVVFVGLIGILLVKEPVFYFGLGDVYPALLALPFIILLVAVALFWALRKSRTDRWSTVPALVLLVPVLVGCAYWGMFW